jgi:hypothetical protein
MSLNQKLSGYKTIMNRIVVPCAAVLLFSVMVIPPEVRGAADPFAVISKKNLFRPDRTEWVLEKSDGKMVDKKIDTSKLSLFGTVIVGDKKSAIIHDKDAGKNPGKKNPAEEPAEKKNEIYSLGDYIGGYVISAIEEKRVVLDYYGEKVTLNLHEGKEGAKGDFTPIEAAPPPPQPAASQPAKPLKQRVQEQQDQKKAKEEMEDQLAAGQIPEALANSPFMSQDNMKKLLDFNKEIMDELKDSGGNMDQYAIKDRVEKFRDRFMEEMGGAQPPGAPE